MEEARGGGGGGGGLGKRNRGDEKKTKRGLLDFSDDQIREILRRLGMGDRVRVSALCKRFRELWEQMPLDLDDGPVRKALGPYKGTPQKVATILSSLVENHGGPIRSITFCFLWLQVLLNQYNVWESTGMFSTLDTLYLDFTGHKLAARRRIPDLMEADIVVPPAVFRGDVLRSVTLVNCSIAAERARFVSERLTHLKLCNVSTKPGIMDAILLAEPTRSNLQSFILTGIPHSEFVLTIDRFPSLQRMFIFLTKDAKEEVKIIVNDCASLEELYITQAAYGPHLMLHRVPKLKFLGYLGWSSRMLDIGRSHFEEISDWHVSGIKDDGLGILHIDTELDCMEHTLREVMLWSFSHFPISICNFFLSTAKVLDSVTYVESGIACSSLYWVDEVMGRINFENMASAGAKVRFCFDKEAIEPGFDLNAALNTPYNNDPCRICLGSEFAVYSQIDFRGGGAAIDESSGSIAGKESLEPHFILSPSDVASEDLKYNPDETADIPENLDFKVMESSYVMDKSEDIKPADSFEVSLSTKEHLVQDSLSSTFHEVEEKKETEGEAEPEA